MQGNDMVSCTEEKGIQIRLIQQIEDFEILKDEWDELLQNSSSNCIFLTWEWAYTWWKFYNKNRELFIVLVVENGKIVGIAPLCLAERSHIGIRSLISLEFMGGGEVCSEYLDFILLRGREKQLIYLLLNEMVTCYRNKWHIINLISMNENSNNIQLLESYCKANCYWYEKRNFGQNFYIILPKTVDDLFKSLSSDRRKKFRKYRRNLASKFDLKLISEVRPEEFEVLFSNFVKLHQKRWSSKGGGDSFNEENTRFIDFHREIARQFLKKKWLYLVFLKANDHIVSVQYDFIYNRVLTNYQSGFDPDWSEHGVGVILQGLVLEQCIESSLLEFDFLRGVEDYKLSWTKCSKKRLDIIVVADKAIIFEITVINFARKILSFIFPANFKKLLYSKLLSKE